MIPKVKIREGQQNTKQEFQQVDASQSPKANVGGSTLLTSLLYIASVSSTKKTFHEGLHRPRSVESSYIRSKESVFKLNHGHPWFCAARHRGCGIDVYNYM